MYRFLIRPLLFLLPAEAAHRFAFAVLRFLMRLPFVERLCRALLCRREPELRVRALGLEFPNPILLAAGFDKNAEGYDALGALGFGAVEIGTVTREAQPGNERPRLFRLVADRALVNRMGFNNDGAARVAARLSRQRHTLVGVNIGKNRTTPEDRAIEDYVESATRLAPFADYVVVNVSSPNTPGLRGLQAKERLRPLLVAVREALARARPDKRLALLVKIAPDLSEEAIDEVADLALELSLDGIIATNTTVARDDLHTPQEELEAIGAGGLSGAPLKARALSVLERLRARVGDRVVLVAAGGIEDADDAWERIRAGATLVQVYTGFVYAGPTFPVTLARGIAERVRACGYQSLSEAVGSGLALSRRERRLPSFGSIAPAASRK
ncbi:MAG: quinone-dependent dihydroorotate dehydrogenase [Pseudomonadota bacterium]